jgi:hypothetical protein
VKLTSEQAAAQRAQAKFTISHPTRSVSPFSDPSAQSKEFTPHKDGSQLPSHLNSPVEYPLVPVKRFLSSDVSAQPATQAPMPVNSDGDEEQMTEDQKIRSDTQGEQRNWPAQEDQSRRIQLKVGQKA